MYCSSRSTVQNPFSYLLTVKILVSFVFFVRRQENSSKETKRESTFEEKR